MMPAYSQLKGVLEAQRLSVPELQRRIQRRGMRINLKSLYRLTNEREPLGRLDLRVAAAICEVCQVLLSDLITFRKPRPKLRRLAAANERRLESLMAKNNDGNLTLAERSELRGLVREAEDITVANARALAGQRKRLTAQ
jgi:hypothetical protein